MSSSTNFLNASSGSNPGERSLILRITNNNCCWRRFLEPAIPACSQLPARWRAPRTWLIRCPRAGELAASAPAGCGDAILMSMSTHSADGLPLVGGLTVGPLADGWTLLGPGTGDVDRKGVGAQKGVGARIGERTSIGSHGVNDALLVGLLRCNLYVGRCPSSSTLSTGDSNDVQSPLSCDGERSRLRLGGRCALFARKRR